MKQVVSIVVIAGLFAATACNNSAVREKDAALQAQQHTIDSMNTELAKKRVIDSMNEVTKTQYVMTPPITSAPISTGTSVRHTTRHNYSSHATTHSSTATASQPVVYQEAPKKKKGWSAKAKGAVIGTATGAAAGAIINGRNRAAGAVIGGILGAGAGTGVGAVIDKKNGR